MTENLIGAAEPWGKVAPEFRRCFAMAWELWRAGSFPVGTLITDASGTIVAEGRNRQFEKSAPNGHLFNTWLTHGEIDAIGQLPVAEYTDYTLWTLVCCAPPRSFTPMWEPFVGPGLTRCGEV